MNKKWTAALSAGLLAGAVVMAGCGNDSATTDKKANAEQITLKVGASPVPHAEVLNNVKDALAKEGIKLEVVEFSDYIQPNMALSDKELDANYFQHKPYLDNFISEHQLKLVSAGAVHIEPMGIYSHSVKDLAAVPQGSKVAIPNDPTNGGRALLLLQEAGLIKLNPDAGITATVVDITDNPKQLAFSELEAAQVPRSLDDVALAVVNTNYAIEAGLTPSKDALQIESKESPYVNIVAVRQGDENRPEIQKLMKALQSQATKDFLEKKYNGAIFPAF